MKEEKHKVGRTLEKEKEGVFVFFELKRTERKPLGGHPAGGKKRKQGEGEISGGRVKRGGKKGPRPGF